MASETEAGAEFIRSWLDTSHLNSVPGAIVSIDVAGESIFNQSYGFADISSGEAMTTSHQFQIASQSKLFTAAAVLQLQEKGLLNIKDSAAISLPELKHADDPRSANITVEQLLTHTSGLSRDGAHANFWELASPFPNDKELMDQLVNERLVFSPSLQMKYSNLGYAALGSIIERVSDSSYEDYITHNIIEPLGLNETSVGRPLDASRIPTAYSRQIQGKRSALPLNATDAFTPATGIYSTTRNLLRFYSELNPNTITPTILSSDSLKEMRIPRVTALHSGGIEYGLGVDIGSDAGVNIVGHGGGFPGHRSGTIVDAKYDISVSAFTNSIDSDAFSIAIDTARVMRYFLENGPVSDTNQKRFNTTLESIWRQRQIIAVGNKVLSVDPSETNPFSDTSIEILNPLADDKLVITQSNSFDSPGEQVLFPKHAPGTVVYAGRTLKKIPPTDTDS